MPGCHIAPYPSGFAFHNRTHIGTASRCARVAILITIASHHLLIASLFVDFLANEKGVPRSKVKSWTPYPGGAPCNVATCLTKLGVPTAFVSAIGNDDRGEEVMALMKSESDQLSAIYMQ